MYEFFGILALRWPDRYADGGVDAKATLADDNWLLNLPKDTSRGQGRDVAAICEFDQRSEFVAA